MQSKLLNAKGEEVGQVDLKEEIFGVKPRKEFLHEYVTVYMTNQRLGTAHTKTRAEVSGSGKKPWKQKHTGRARAGSFRSPLWRKGGITFGPRKHDMSLDFPRQKSKIALAQALSARLADGGLVFVESFKADGKTKSVASALKALGCQGKTLLVLDQQDPKLTQAGRNIDGLQLSLAGDLNAYVVLAARKLVLTKAALEKLASRYN
jgi:large subunit ribosomal protein L4